MPISLLTIGGVFDVLLILYYMVHGSRYVSELVFSFGEASAFGV
jgi:hypothetical protein